MRNDRFLTWLVAVALIVAAVAGTASLTSGLASAAPLRSTVATTPAQAGDTTTTTITLMVTPGSPADPITTPTLTATVTPSTATGTVQFSSDSFTLGDPVPVTNGTASTTIPQATGEHFLVADFTPTDPGYSGSISNTVDYTTPASAPATGATPTTLTLEVTPGLATAPTSTPTLTATIIPPTVTGTVQFTSDGTTLGDPVPLTEGTASTTTPVPAGEHSLIAEFTPTDSAYGRSISNAVSYTTTSTGAPATGAMITTVTLQVTPAVPADASTAPRLTATITPPSATGTVQFTSDGTTLGDPVPVTEGTATTPVPAGDHFLIAEFTPTDSTALSTSISNTVHYTTNSTPASEGIPATH